MNRTAIQWTAWTANPIRFRSRDTGKTLNHCVKVSAGCAHCYAERITVGWPGLHGREHAYTAEGTARVEPYLDRDVLRTIATTRRKGRLFVEDMSDLFGEWVPDEWLDECFAAFALSSLTIQVLTKRADRLLAYFNAGPVGLETRQEDVLRAAEHLGGVIFDDRGSDRHLYPPRCGDVSNRRRWPGWPLPNVWLGVSVEDQATADKRIPLLLRTPAAVRFVSCEPMLGPLRVDQSVDAGPGAEPCGLKCAVERGLLHWFIFGGESGKAARPCDVAWIRDGVRQCRQAGAAVFVKQLGSRPAYSHDVVRENGTEFTWGWAPHVTFPLACTVKLRDSHGGDPAEWPSDLRVREFPEVHA